MRCASIGERADGAQRETEPDGGRPGEAGRGSPGGDGAPLYAERRWDPPLAPTLVSRIAFHTGGPFAHIDNDAGLYAVLDVCALATQRSGATGVPSQFDVINNLREKSAPFEALRELVRTNRLTTDPGPDWAGVLRLIDVVGVETLERAAVLLASCVRADAPPGTAQFVTIHASKGLSYPWVVLADDWGPRADAEASARECYVAITRSEDDLAIPASLHARLL
ncbi:hypothetical protein M885DRAFT_536391 [Pelagophyceae sp. CCMP2097]|nr:hypothetical protein M885DRAFT_536391 [Pelagophyceae sp. CCMP2097]